jgi:hypothetical protein
VSGKLYKPSAYYVAKQLAVLPFAVLNSLLFAFTLYGLAGLRHSAVAVGINGLMSVLIYLIAAQVRKRKHMGSSHGRAVVTRMHQLVVQSASSITTCLLDLHDVHVPCRQYCTMCCVF